MTWVSPLRACRALFGITRNWILNGIDAPVVMLLYHRVIALDSDPQQLAVSPATFFSHMRYLRDNFPILRLDEEWLSVKTASIVITFDDGYADNVHNALPILQELKVPATFFISTGTLGTGQEFWWDELERIILAAGVSRPFVLYEDGEVERLWSATTREERWKLYRDMHRLLRTADPVRREEWIEQLRAWADVGRKGRESHRAMSVDELRTLARSEGVSIGAHSVTHTSLSCLTPDEQKEEIVSSKEQLASWIGEDVRLFSYPFGSRSDYTGDTRRLCDESSFFRAAGNFPGQVHKWTDRMQMPRQVVRDWPLNEFVSHLSRFWVA